MSGKERNDEEQGIQMAIGIVLDDGGIAQMTLHDDRLQIGKFTAGDMISLIAIFRDAADALEDELSRITN